jgi:hypothetical protein
MQGGGHARASRAENAGGCVTPLQIWLNALHALLDDARAELDDEAWAAFVDVACERVGHEAAQRIVAAALRITDEAGEEAA